MKSAPAAPAYARRGISQSHKRKLYRQWLSSSSISLRLARTIPNEMFPRFLPFNAKFK